MHHLSLWRICIFTFCFFLFVQATEIFQQFELGDSVSSPQLKTVLSKYLSNGELAEQMQGFTDRKDCSSISKVFSIGKSANGTEMWGLEISSNPGIREAKPAFKYVANMHGDEPSGRMLLMGLAEWLCANWRTNAHAKRMVEDVKLYLVPTLNPDGFALKQRGNLAGIDLNRNFPDPILSSTNLQPKGTEQPETLNVMKWISSMHFVASASMHEGAYVANYPWDGSDDGTAKTNETSDADTFKYLARSYASLDPKINGSEEFPTGITNGAAWYPLWGGMQDWNYVVGKCMELTLELSLNKYPPASQLNSIWNDNIKSLINYPFTALFGGLRGFVFEDTGSDGKKPLAANITIVGSNWTLSSSSDFGDFYRPLAPGQHTVVLQADGYSSNTSKIFIPADNSGLQLNFTLSEAGVEGRKLGLQRHGGLPRKLGGFDIISSDQMTAEEDMLISQEMWINMMQVAMYLLLGFVLSGASVVLMLFMLQRYHRTRQRSRS